MHGRFENSVFAAFNFHHFAVQASKCSRPHPILRLRRGYGMVPVGCLIGAAYCLAWACQSRMKYISCDPNSGTRDALRLVAGRCGIPPGHLITATGLRELANG